MDVLELVVIEPPLPSTDTIEGLPVPLPQNPHVVERPGSSLAFHSKLAAVNCPSDRVIFATHPWSKVEPLSPTTMLQPVVGLELLFVTVTLAQYPLPQSEGSVSRASIVPSALSNPDRKESLCSSPELPGLQASKKNANEAERLPSKRVVRIKVLQVSSAESQVLLKVYK
ncbi:hypothetical protein WMF15_42310 [Sorangium sp. So ce233]